MFHFDSRGLDDPELGPFYPNQVSVRYLVMLLVEEGGGRDVRKVRRGEKKDFLANILMRLFFLSGKRFLEHRLSRRTEIGILD